MGSNSVAVDYDYNSAKQLSSILSPSGTRYNFTYDQFGRSTETRIGNTKLIENTYDAKGLLTSSTYGNNTVMNRAYDALNRLISISRDTTKLFEYGYDGSGRISEVRDILAETLTKYEYDILDRAVGEKLIDVNTNKVINSYSVSYDNKNRVSGYSNNIEGTEKSIQYVYGSGNNQYADIVYGLILNGATVNNISYTYDTLNRRTAKTINTTTPFITEYTYMAGRTKGSTTDNSSLTTTLIQSVKNGNDTLSYTYDNNGNIKTISKNNVLQNTYHYDELNQLIREDNVGRNTIVYTYNSGGNITFRKTYAYTEPNVAVSGTPTKTDIWGYGSTEWKDKVTAYNAIPMSYDEIGNLTSYRGATLTWQNGRQLANITIGANNSNISFTYNADGIRTSKTVNGIKTEYILNGDSIICEIRNAGTATEYRIYYHYDESGNLVAFDYNNQTYYYIRNAQNDIIGIVDSTGTQVVSYEYDAWGNKLSVKDANGSDVSSNASHIANINPFRYRGYYYDSETSFYYLQSRYYAPEICRFINADGYVSTGQGILGHNMFAYCRNNPVNRFDPTGLCDVTIFDAIRAVNNRNRDKAMEIKDQLLNCTCNDPVDYYFPLPGYKRSDDFPTYPRGGDHTGTDIPAPEGTKIHSAYSGKIVDISSSESKWFGNYVVVETNIKGIKYRMYYAHMKETADLKIGWDVEAGTVIGYVGHTGNAYGNHLHFEVREAPYSNYPNGGSFVDPRPFLK